MMKKSLLADNKNPLFNTYEHKLTYIFYLQLKIYLHQIFFPIHNNTEKSIGRVSG
jgi:hypothetical protein